jgi:hypothetical protein
MKRKVFSRWWYVRSDQCVYGHAGLETIGYMTHCGGDDFVVAGGPLPTRWFIENAARLFTRKDIDEAIAHFKRFRSDTNIRAVRVTVWRKTRR